MLKNSKKLILWKYALRRILQDLTWLCFTLYMEKYISNKISWWTVVAIATIATINIRIKYFLIIIPIRGVWHMGFQGGNDTLV